MPTNFDNMGWCHVLCNDGSNCAVCYLLCNDDGKVVNELICEIAPSKKVPSSFHSLVKHVFVNHTHHRKKPHESGIMGCLGRRREIKCSSVTDYRPSPDELSSVNRTTHKLHANASIDFHNFVSDSSLQCKYDHDIALLKKEKNKCTWKIRDTHLHPTTAVAISLTNSSHQDPNDHTPSIAVWYTDPTTPGKPGKSWFLLPYYSIAVECSTTTIIRFDGKNVQHCSCTVNGGKPVFSILKGSRVDVVNFNRIIQKMDTVSKKKKGRKK